MRLRLLIDVYWDDDKIPGLQGLVADQEGVIIQLPLLGYERLGGRLMGAVPVEAIKEDGEAH